MQIKNLSGDVISETAGTDLQSAQLQNANLVRADLHEATLQWADLRTANLERANLRWANLQGAKLQGAKLQGADFHAANLQAADLRGADLRGANLFGANLAKADLRGSQGLPQAIAAQLNICPEGTLIVYKKAGNEDTQEPCIVVLRIHEATPRSNATGRKCRAAAAEVLRRETLEGEPLPVAAIVRSLYDKDFLYPLGATVAANIWEPDRWIECAGGIHFYLTREEAVGNLA